MATKYLFRSQVNDLVRAILKSQLDSNSFEFDRDFSNNALQFELPLTVQFRDSAFYFNIIHFWGGFQGHYFPNLEKKMGEGGRAYDSWSELVEEFVSWLRRINEEINEPNPWLLLRQGNIMTNEIPVGDRGEETFSEGELVKLHEHIEVIRQFLLSEVKPNLEQTRIINEKLGFLEEAALRQNKKDWSHTAIGVTFTIAVGLAMAPTQAHQLFDLVSEFIKAISLRLLQ